MNPPREPDGPTRLEAIRTALAGAALVALPMWALWLARTAWRSDEAYVWIDVHHAVVGVATLLGAGITVVAIRGLRRDSSAFHLYVAMAFLVETYLYAFHGIFTSAWDRQPALFLLYGPASRLAFGVLLAIAVYHLPQPRRIAAWPTHVAVGAVITTLVVVAIGAYASSSVADVAAGRDRIALELLALATMAAAFTLLLRTVWWRFAILRYLLGALVLFCASSVAFLAVERPFDATFWTAHVIFAAGFVLLGYGVVTLRTRSHSLTEVLDISSLESSLRDQRARQLYDERFRALVGAVAHEQNNLMAAMTAAAESVAAGRGTPGGKDAAPSERLRRATERAKVLSRRLLALSGSVRKTPTAIPLTKVVRDTVDGWRRSASHDVTLDDRLGSARVHVDPSYFSDAVVALLDNARTATRDGGGIRVRAWVVASADGRRTAHVAVIDEGHGMDLRDPELLTSLAGATGDARQGVGLGLPFVARVVEAAVGRLELHGRPGRGFRATIVLPCATEDVTAPTAASTAMPGRSSR